MEKKGSNNLVIAVIILAFLVVSLGAYIAYNEIKKNNNPETKTSSNVSDNVKKEKLSRDFDSVKYQVTMNGATKDIVVNYKFEYIDKEPGSGKNDWYQLTGYINNEKVYYLENDTINGGQDLPSSEYVSIEIAKKYFNENNLNVIKGRDGKDYLVVETYEYSSTGGYNIRLVVFDSNLKKLSGDFKSTIPMCSGQDIELLKDGSSISLEGGVNPLYKKDISSWYIYDNTKQLNVYAKIENNKIYYLEPVFNSVRPVVDGYLEERAYTINNGEFEYDVINKYKIIDVAGATCLIDDTVTYDVTLNGVKKSVQIKYSFDDLSGNSAASSESYEVTGTFNGEVVYQLTNYDDASLPKRYYGTISEAKKHFNKNNLKVIKGKDGKDYLVIETYLYNSEAGASISYKVYDANLNKINGSFSGIAAMCDTNDIEVLRAGAGTILETGVNPWYKKEITSWVDAIFYSGKYVDVYAKIENNKIYYLESKYSSVGNVLEERVYTLNNGKFEYEVINKFNIESGAGATCGGVRDNSDSNSVKYQVTMNGVKKDLVINYSLKAYPNEPTYTYEGKLNGNVVYSLHIDASDVTNYTRSKYATVEEAKKHFNQSNFTVITGKDNKNYLVVKKYLFGSVMGETLSYEVYDQNLNKIQHNFNAISLNCTSDSIQIYLPNSGVELNAGVNPWYKTDTSSWITPNVSNVHIHAKIENNKIYYLEPVPERNYSSLNGTLEERAYTINNGKFEYEVINKYKIVGGAGQAC